ncbi:hypothetical protein R9X47_00270 [Wukongibacter baidiensis]|uniref:hypothetical protein n=1 Tax=Wukongibacter baidiensis TaxID=1723361 RepID=UPI003D7FBB32
MMKFLNNKQLILIVKWFAAACAVILLIASSLGLWLIEDTVTGDYLIPGFVAYIFIFLFFLLPLIKYTLINKDESAELEYKSTFVVQGVISILLVYSSYMTFVFESRNTGLWLWSLLISVLILVVIDIVRIALKEKSKCPAKLDRNKVSSFINRIIMHGSLIVLMLLFISKIYDTSKVVDLDNIKSPIEIFVVKMDANKKGFKSIVDRVNVSDLNTIEDMIDEIKENKKVENLRGARNIDFEKSYRKSDFYYWVIPSYGEYIKEKTLDKGYFNNITIQPNGYVVIEEERHPARIYKNHYLRYKIVLSQSNIDKIIQQAFKSNKEDLN